jgi:alpha(1,3/1,4) fucosyltransferase
MNKKVVYFYANWDESEIFGNSSRDNSSSTIKELRSKFIFLGYDFMYNSQDFGEDSLGDSLIIFWNVNHRDSFLEKFKRVYRRFKYNKKQIIFHHVFKKAKKLHNKKLILILFEGLAVMPELYLNKQYLDFDAIFTWNDSLLGDDKVFKYYMPVPNIRLDVEKHDYFDKKFMCCIAYNKTSSVKNELYSERVRAIHYFNKMDCSFDLYGFGWDVNIFSSYRGSVKNKLDALVNYRFCLCFENYGDSPGYVTEKIFDCFFAGVVPIYYGATNIAEMIPANSFVDFREYDSLDDLYKLLTNIDEKEYLKYINNANSFIHSNNFELFTNNAFINKFIIDIEV